MLFSKIIDKKETYFEKFIRIITNAYYYTLKTDNCDYSHWSDTTVSKAMGVVPDSFGTLPLFLSIDDTMVEKSGKKFELCPKLFGHAAHNGSNYLIGHCMVSILLSFPVSRDGQTQYLSVPLGYRLWNKEKSKLETAAEMVRQAMGVIDPSSQVFLLCDSWYPKAEVAGLIKEFGNLGIICNARVGTAMYELPPCPYRKARTSPEIWEAHLPGRFWAFSSPKW